MAARGTRWRCSNHANCGRFCNPIPRVKLQRSILPLSRSFARSNVTAPSPDLVVPGTVRRRCQGWSHRYHAKGSTLMIMSTGSIQDRIGLAYEMIGRNNDIEMDLIEQLALIALQPPHLSPAPRRSTSCQHAITVRRQQQPTSATKSPKSGR
jgi:hypothetical protein